MATVLERVAHLLALSDSPNEHEARNAAWLAVGLIRKHRLVLSMPVSSAGARTRSRPDVRRDTPAKRSRSSPRSVKRVADPPERIVAPLGGDCVHCGGRYAAGQTIFWFASGGGLHARCVDAWSRKEK